MELDTKSISILNKPPKTVIFRCLLTINHERQKPLFCPKTLARQALEPQVFRPESLRFLQWCYWFGENWPSPHFPHAKNSTLINTALRVALVTLISASASYFYVMSNLERQTREQLEKYILERESSIFQLAESNLTFLKHQLLHHFNQLASTNFQAEFDRLFFPWPVGFIHGNLTHINQYSQDLLRLMRLYQEYFPDPPTVIQETIEEIDLEFIEKDLIKVLGSMEIGTDRIRNIVLSLRNFSRLDQAEFKAVDIHEGIDSTLVILQNRLKGLADSPEIEVVKNYGNLPLVECYAGQLNQVFMNVLANAIDALNDDQKYQTFNKVKNNSCRIMIDTQVIRDGLRSKLAITVQG